MDEHDAGEGGGGYILQCVVAMAIQVACTYIHTTIRSYRVINVGVCRPDRVVKGQTYMKDLYVHVLVQCKGRFLLRGVSNEYKPKLRVFQVSILWRSQ